MTPPRKPRKQPEPLDTPALYAHAVKALGRKMRTVAELKRLLRSRVEPGDSGQAKIDVVVQTLKDQHYLNDTAYAAAYTRLRQENERFGRRRVQQDLMRRGVHSDIATPAIDTAYASISEEDLARQHLARKRIPRPTNDKEIARVMRRLTVAGFPPGIIFTLLKKWDIEISEDAIVPDLGS